MPDHHDSALITGSKDIVAGCARGIAQVCVGHPLDTIKVRLQTQGPGSMAYSGVTDCFKKTLAAEGFFGFYKGASSPIGMAALYSAVLFLAYGQTKRFLSSGSGNELGFHQQVAAGVCTGFAASFIESPMDLFKSKMQVQNQKISQELLVYRHAFDAARQIYLHNGVPGLFRGLSATMCRNIPGTAIYFYVYEATRSVLGPPTTISIMISGGIGGMAFWTSVYPFDVIKSSLQADTVNKTSRKYGGVVHCAKTIFANEGFRGFYKGFKACLIRSFPVNACSFLAYEHARKYLSGFNK